MRTLWTLLVLLFSVSAMGEVIARFDDLSHHDGWTLLPLGREGDPPGAAMPSLSNRTLLVAEGDGSWVFLKRLFTAQELPGNTVRLTARVRGNTRSARFAITETFDWGNGFGGDLKIGFTAAPWETETVVVEYHRKYPDQMLSVAAGLDYHAAGSFLEIESLTVEAGDALPPVAMYQPWAESRYDGGIAGVWKRRAARLQEVDLPEAIRQRLAAVEALIAAPRPLTASEVREIEDLLASAAGQSCVAGIFPGMTPYGQHSGADAWPASCERLDLAANERESALLLIRNNTADSRIYAVETTGIPVELAQLFEYDGIPDLAKPLAAGEYFKIGANETAGILLTVDSRVLTPGLHPLSVSVAGLGGAPQPEALNLEVAVHGVVLPELNRDTTVFAWDYDRVTRPEWLEFLIDLGVNNFTAPQLPGGPDPDFSGLDTVILRLNQRLGPGNYVVQLPVGFMRTRDNWKPEYGPWIDRLTAHLEGLGLGYGDWYLHAYDEDLTPGFLAFARGLKAHNPSVRLFSDWIVEDAQVLRDFAPCVDFWCPPTSTLYQPAYRDALEAMRSAGGHTFLTYRCDAKPANGLWQYRLQPWIVHDLGLDGAGFWTVNPVGIDGEFFGNYSAPGGSPLPSRRFLAWRDGWEDFRLLRLAGGHPDVAATARLSDDQAASEAVFTLRRELLESLSR